MKPEATAIGDPQDGRWKNNLNVRWVQVLRTEIFRSFALQQNDVIGDFRRPASA